MGTLAKINGIAVASIAKVNGIAIASIAKVNGHDWPAAGPDYGWHETLNSITADTEFTGALTGEDEPNAVLEDGSSGNRFVYRPTGGEPYLQCNGQAAYLGWDAFVSNATYPEIELQIALGTGWTSSCEATIRLRSGGTTVIEMDLWNSGGVHYISPASGVNATVAIVLGTAFTLRFNMNYAADTYDCYFNDTLKLDDRAFDNAVSSCSELKFWHNGNGTTQRMIFYDLNTNDGG